MFYFLSLFAGIIITVMVAVNGLLSGVYGIYVAAIIIHVVGLVFIGTVVLVRGENPFRKWHPWFFYLGGAIGVMTTVSNNFAFGRISVSSIMALGLLGQSLTGILIDHYGLLGMPKHRLNKSKWVGIVLVLMGILAMTDVTNFELTAILVSFIAGVCIVSSRTFNAKLTAVTSSGVSTFFNYVVGLLGCLLVFLLLGRGEPGGFSFTAFPIYMYFGGLLGVAVVFLFNVLVVKISAFYMTLFVFVGQVFSGVAIDFWLDGFFSVRILIGGIFAALGMCWNLYADTRTLSAVVGGDDAVD